VKNFVIDGRNVKLQIWDFAGEERFRFLLPIYAKGANGGIFLYDVTALATLHHLPDWMEIINQNTPDIPILMVGTKTDLISQRKVVSAEAVHLVKDQKFAGFAEVSAKTGANVEHVFEVITKIMIKKSS
jgi:small GTP-binding protein